MAEEKEYCDLEEFSRDGDSESEQDGDEEEEIEMWDLTSPPEYEWFHGCLDRKTSEERLMKAGRAGSFLVRESERKPGSFCISFLSHNGINHFRITAVCGDYYIGGRQFQSVSDLVGYYMKISTLLEDEQLEFPVPPPEPIADRRRVIAKYPYEKTPDTDELSFSQGDIFLVEANINDDWLWVRSMRNRHESGLIPVALVEKTDDHMDPYEGREWFNSRITKDETRDLLMGSPIGSFIVRPSDTVRGDYSLSVRISQSVSRFRIQHQKHQYVMGGRLFDSLDSIIERYKTEHVAENLSLQYPSKWRSGSANRDSTVGEVEAYAAFRSRPGPVIVKRIDTSKKDWLFKKGSKSNRWKQLLFTLNSSEQQLFMHENEKRAKPKGLIDLSYATLMSVHPSLFGKPHCFQIIVRAFNEKQFYYLCADTEEAKRDWLCAIAKCCGSRNSRLGASRHGVRQLQSLHLTVVEARKLPKHSHAFCRIHFDDMKVARTPTKVASKETQKDSCEIIWDEVFKFEDLPLGLTAVSVGVYMKNKRLKDSHVGSVDIPLSSLPNLSEQDEWYVLGAAKGQGKAGPSARIKVKFMHEVIMSIMSYEPLKELLLAQDLLAIKALESVCKDSVRKELAATLVRIFRREKQVIQLLRTIASQEIEREGDIGTMFRGNTLATLLMDQFMGMVAVPYRQSTLRNTIQYVIQLEQSCELDPTLVSQHTPVISENLERLIGVLERLLKEIYNSCDSCPIALRYLFGCLQKSASEKWPERPEARTRIVSAFLFLRLLGPALLKPKMFNLTSEQPSDTANRTLKLLTKALQTLANLLSFTGKKEPYMAQVNPFLERNQKKMVSFIDELSNIPHCPVTDGDVSSIDLARELATVHHLCVSHHEQLDKLSQDQPHVKRLTAVTLMLTQDEETLTAHDNS